MARFSATQVDIFLALILSGVALGYSVSGLPPSIVWACVIWTGVWVCLSHLFFIHDATSSCPLDVKLAIWGALTFLIVAASWTPIKMQYEKEHTPPPAPLQPERREPAPAPALPVPKSPPPPRSYMVFNGQPYLGVHGVLVDANAKPLADQSWQVGQELAFNFEIKATGPNPVEVFAIIPELYLEDGNEAEPAKQVIAKFKKTLTVLCKKHACDRDFMTVPAGQVGFRTAFLRSETGKEDQHRTVTRDDLDAFHSGTKMIFVIAEMTYKDGGKVHHERMCNFVLPPALFPTVIWETCGGFGNSD